MSQPRPLYSPATPKQGMQSKHDDCIPCHGPSASQRIKKRRQNAANGEGARKPSVYSHCALCDDEVERRREGERMKLWWHACTGTVKEKLGMNLTSTRLPEVPVHV